MKSLMLALGALLFAGGVAVAAPGSAECEAGKPKSVCSVTYRADCGLWVSDCEVGNRGFFSATAHGCRTVSAKAAKVKSAKVAKGDCCAAQADCCSATAECCSKKAAGASASAEKACCASKSKEASASAGKACCDSKKSAAKGGECCKSK